MDGSDQREGASTTGVDSSATAIAFVLQILRLPADPAEILHRSGTTTLGEADLLLGGLRTYIFAHTSNRIDVELGARLFRHLLGLPLAYFQARRVGDTVTRVRELDTIRQFLTSSAITLVRATSLAAG